MHMSIDEPGGEVSALEVDGLFGEHRRLTDGGDPSLEDRNSVFVDLARKYIDDLSIDEDDIGGLIASGDGHEFWAGS
jgi:hypothetical protein